MRIGSPLYRLQQEAMRMRLQCRRIDFERFEDFYIDENFYPNLGFEDFSRGEKQKLLLNVIQAVPTNEAALLRGVLQGTAKVAHSSASPWYAARAIQPSTAHATSQNVDDVYRSKRREPHVAGISLSHYIKYRVVKDFVVLHDAVQRHNLLEHWRISSLGSREYWRTELLDYFSESKQNEYAALERALKYYGHKIGFYLGFLSYFTNWLVAPALAGIFCFGLEFVPSEYESQISNDTSGDEKFDDQYDHPMMFAFGLFLCLWNTAVVRGWETKSKELAFRWKVDDYAVRNPMPNPLSTAPVRLQYVGGGWAYRAVMTRIQRRNQLRNTLLVSLPIFLLFLGCVVGYTYGVFELDDFLERQREFFDNFDDKRLKKKNWKGELAFYGATGLQAVVIWLLNTVYDKVAVWCTKRENHETIELFDSAVAMKVLAFKFCNNYSSLFYYAYYKYDIDGVAAQLASILVVTQLLNNFTEYMIPWLSGSKLATEKAEDMVRRLEKTKRSARSQADDPEGGGDDGTGPSDIGSLAANMTKELQEANNELVKQAKSGTGGGAVSNLKETYSEARDEVTMEDQCVALEFAEILIQFGFVSMFGAAWPLAPLLALLNNFFEVRLDIWKFSKLQRRPVSERVNSVGPFWKVAFEIFCLFGICNHCFLLCVSSNTMREYFFPKISMTERIMVAFIAENFFLLCYALVRIVSLDYIPQWMVLKKKEPLRFVRDAYRAGCALRERSYRMMLANPFVTRKQICKNEDIDENSAERYLKIVRYVDGMSLDERKQLMYNSSTTIYAFLTTIMLKARCGQWTDQGECPTAPGLLRQLVPITNLRRAYDIGKRVRESAYAIWEAHQDVTVMGSRSATVMSIRQFACIDAGCTLPQAERYCRLVRYVDRSGGNPYEVLAQLTVGYPRGLMDVLAVIAEEAAPDPGEPVPAELGPHIDPVVYAKRAFERADVVRRKMFERWVLDKQMGTDELVTAVAEEMGANPPQLHRYLLIKRYCDSLDDRRRKDVLVYAQSGTLALTSNINALIREGAWRDPGEMSFLHFIPPIVVDHSDLDGN
ncbi:Anoctamin-8 [Pycnococcus provasolii]|uniref:Anoctamin-8 n=1 Tax=Pycnococcus provasolii TaxID=41880 RepID=A0A830HKC2_9CHLO|nr:Anoctamin-8 [Pycnococcus provasolii]